MPHTTTEKEAADHPVCELCENAKISKHYDEPLVNIGKEVEHLVHASCNDGAKKNDRALRAHYIALGIIKPGAP